MLGLLFAILQFHQHAAKCPTYHLVAGLNVGQRLLAFRQQPRPLTGTRIYMHPAGTAGPK